MKLTFAALSGFLLAATLAPLAHAQDEAKAPGKDAKKVREEEKEYLVAPEQPAVQKIFTKDDVKRFCGKYSGQVIAYYGDVWKVEGCKRRPLLDSKTVYSMQRSGSRVIDVDADVIAAIPEGSPLDVSVTTEQARSCAQLEAHYVSFSSVDVYFIERCKRRLFPDWTTYVKHRDTRGDKKGEILSLSLIEFERTVEGEPYPSVVDDMFAKLLTGQAGVEIIPIDEACEGIDGRYMAFYSRLYHIERCKKREILEPEFFLKKNGNLKIDDMRDQQWLSLPDGEPILPAPKGPQGAPPKGA